MIEPMPARWTNPVAKEMFDYMQAQIVESFRLPPHLIGGHPEAIDHYITQQKYATAYLVAQCCNLLIKYTTPTCSVH